MPPPQRRRRHQMAAITDAQKLTMLKTDLGISVNSYDTRLSQYIKAAEASITREGVTLNDEAIDDVQLTVMYAAWMWQRRDGGEGMPRMLRYKLNNRIFSEKMKEA